MPIYAYKCESCGYARDVLQKLSDVPLTDCPQCGASSFKKQLTAAGFQLKGSGWYVTDFRGGDSGAKADKAGDTAPATAASADSKTAPGSSATATPAPAAAASSAASASKTSSGDAAPKAS